MRPRQAPGFPGASLGFCPVSLRLARPKGISMRVTFVTRPGPNGLACGPYPPRGGGVLWPSAPGGPGTAAALPPPPHSSSHSRVPDVFLTCMPCAHTSVRSVKEEEGCRGHSLKGPGQDSMEPRLGPALKVVLRGPGHDPSAQPGHCHAHASPPATAPS